MAANGRTIRRNAAGAKQEGDNILPFRRELRLNIGLVVLAFIFLYLVFSLIRSATRTSYSTYQVGREETLNGSHSYQAIILRSEQVISSRWAGYVDVFVPEGSHVSVGSVVSSVDEIGTYSQSIKDVSGMQSLSSEELMNLRNRLKKLSLTYSGDSFSSVYDTRNSISAFFISHVGSASLAVLEENASLNEFFHVHKSDTSGMVLYYQDGYENKKAETLTKVDFSGTFYSRKTTDDLVTSGDFLYKLVDSENWSLVFPITAQEAALYGSQDTIRFTFLKTGLTAAAAGSVINGADGSLLLKLDLSRYLVQFVTDRFTEIRIDSVGESGFKVPVSCQVTENAYLIPAEYELSGNTGSSGFLQEITVGTTKTVQFITPIVYMRDAEYCYVSRESLAAESVLIKPESQDRYTVRLTQTLTGVYEVNAGYTRFCPVEIIDRNGDYLLVRKGTSGGIATYDVLLLDASRFTVGQILR